MDAMPDLDTTIRARPRAASAVAEEPLQCSVTGDNGARLPGAERRRKRVLIVDDSRMMRELARRELGAQGYDVESASDGLEAWELLRKAPFDLVATDSEMPRMDGFELLARLKQDPVLRSLATVLITARELDSDRQLQLDRAAVSVLNKDAGFQAALLRTVEALIGRAAA
jgi:CheY-like chemotaxis protein